MKTIYFSQARSRALQTLDKPRAGAWIVLIDPSTKELDDLAKDFDLDRDNLTDAIDIYEAPRIDMEDGNVYVYTRYCYPEGQEIATEPLLNIYTSNYLFSIVRSRSDILGRLTGDKLEFVTTQKTKTLLQILTEINRSYRLHLNKVSKQIFQIRAQLRKSDISNRDFIKIIELEEDLNEFVTALQPQATLLKSLTAGKFIRLYEDDQDLVEDLELGTTELIELTNSRLRTLTNIRQAYDAIATNNLNATFKRLTSIAIFLTIPTIIGGIWGMNVRVPYETSPHAFLFIIGLIVLLMTVALAIFYRKKWL